MKAVIMRVICFTATWHIPQNDTTIEINGTELRQARSIWLECQFRVLNHYATENILWMTKSQLPIKQICLPSIISHVTNNRNELWKTVSVKSFQKPQLQSFSISIKFVHPCLRLYLLYYLYLLLTFWAVFLYFAQLGGSLHCPNSGRIRDTQLL